MGRKNENAGENTLHELPRVRWRDGDRWRHGHLIELAVQPDGSLRVCDTDGEVSTLDPHEASVQRQVRGTRGGLRWKGYDTAELLMARTAPRRRSRPGRRQLTAQMDLFGGDVA